MQVYRVVQWQPTRWINSRLIPHRHHGFRLGVIAVGSSTFILGSAIGIRSHWRTTTKCEEKKSDDVTTGPESSPWSSSFKGFMSQLSSLSDKYAQISSELSGEPGSLYQTIIQEASCDDYLNPEILWRASVRLGTDIGLYEKAFLRERKQHMRLAFAKLIGVDPSLVDERDLPIVGIAASGGGYRAMVSTVGCLVGARNSGLLDVTSYISGISGSCWTLGMWYSLAAGSLDQLRTHIKSRIITPFLDLANLQMFVESPTNKYLLSSLINKSSSQGGTTSLVDIYGTLVSSRLFVPDDLRKLDPHHLKLSYQRRLLNGSLPLPIYCAIHHLIPEVEVPSNEGTDVKGKVAAVDRKQSFLSAPYHWYELTPFEVGSEDVGAFIPTWALGRVFKDGRDVENCPELGLPILAGIFASAFTATLAHYYSEAKPFINVLPFFPSLDKYVASFKSDLAAFHPFPPAELPNFLHGLHGQLTPGIPKALIERETIALMDAGAELNIPYVPLFRRGCDVIIALDASADSQDVWFSKAQTYAQKFGLKTWPIVNYPYEDREDEQLPEKLDYAKSNSVNSSKEPRLGRCNIWVGDSSNQEVSSRRDEPDEHWIETQHGPALIYIPLTPGKGLKNPAELWSTWRFDYTPNETEQLLCLSEYNFRYGEREMIKVLRSTWNRKRNRRLGVQST